MYRCPICQETMEHDLARFLSHTDQHILDVIQKRHPEWAGKSGLCQKCLDYYKGQIQGDSSKCGG